MSRSKREKAAKPKLQLSDKSKTVLRRIAKHLPRTVINDSDADFKAAVLATLNNGVQAPRAAATEIRKNADICAKIVRKRMKDARKRKSAQSNTEESDKKTKAKERPTQELSTTGGELDLPTLVSTLRQDWVGVARSLWHRNQYLQRLHDLYLASDSNDDDEDTTVSKAERGRLAVEELELVLSALQSLYVWHGSNFGSLDTTPRFPASFLDTPSAADSSNKPTQWTESLFQILARGFQTLQNLQQSNVPESKLVSLDEKMYKLVSCLLLPSGNDGLARLFQFLETCRSTMTKDSFQQLRVESLLTPQTALSCALSVGTVTDTAGRIADKQALWCIGVGRYLLSRLSDNTQPRSASTAAVSTRAATLAKYSLFLKTILKLSISPQVLTWVKTNASAASLFSDSLKSKLVRARCTTCLSIEVPEPPFDIRFRVLGGIYRPGFFCKRVRARNSVVW